MRSAPVWTSHAARRDRATVGAAARAAHRGEVATRVDRVADDQHGAHDAVRRPSGDGRGREHDRCRAGERGQAAEADHRCRRTASRRRIPEITCACLPSGSTQYRRNRYRSDTSRSAQWRGDGPTAGSVGVPVSRRGAAPGATRAGRGRAAPRWPAPRERAARRARPGRRGRSSGAGSALCAAVSRSRWRRIPSRSVTRSNVACGSAYISSLISTCTRSRPYAANQRSSIGAYRPWSTYEQWRWAKLT